jgi:transcription initiation factor IIE alpha subunit
VIIFTQAEREGDKQRAIELEAKDFIVGVLTSPKDVVLKLRTHLGEQKTYFLPLSEKEKIVQDLARDLGYETYPLCSQCGSPLQLALIRDLGKGENYFKVSFVCPKCKSQ